MSEGELILFRSQDGQSEVQLRVDGDTVWLTQLEIADLFATTKQNVSLHIQNILEEGELPPEATVKDSLTVASGVSSPSSKMFLAWRDTFCFVVWKSSAVSSWVSQTLPLSARRWSWVWPSSEV